MVFRYGLLIAVISLSATIAYAQTRHPGTAVVQVGQKQFTIPIECNDAARPELGFSTEPSRITHEATGRSSGVRLRVRPWKDTTELVVSLDRYVAWVAQSVFSGGARDVVLDMSPASMVRDNMPVALTYDMWNEGDRPDGLKGVRISVDCANRDPVAPFFKKLPD